MKKEDFDAQKFILESAPVDLNLGSWGDFVKTLLENSGCDTEGLKSVEMALAELIRIARSTSLETQWAWNPVWEKGELLGMWWHWEDGVWPL